MQVRKFMSTDVQVVSPDAPVIEAARKMKELDVGSLPVCDGARLQGMITDRDIAIRVVSEGLDPKSTMARDAMTPEVCFVFDEQDLKEAAELMQERQIRRLPVLNREKKLVGIISLADVSDKGNAKVISQTVKEISQPGAAHH